VVYDKLVERLLPLLLQRQLLGQRLRHRIRVVPPHPPHRGMLRHAAHLPAFSSVRPPRRGGHGSGRGKLRGCLRPTLSVSVSCCACAASRCVLLHILAATRLYSRFPWFSQPARGQLRRWPPLHVAHSTVRYGTAAPARRSEGAGHRLKATRGSNRTRRVPQLPRRLERGRALEKVPRREEKGCRCGRRGLLAWDVGRHRHARQAQTRQAQPRRAHFEGVPARTGRCVRGPTGP